MVNSKTRMLRLLLRYARGYIPSLGLVSGTTTFLKLRLLRAESDVVRVRIPLCRSPVDVRTNTCDRKVFEEVFVDRAYALPFRFAPKLIIDGGANVGYSSLFFAGQYPEAEILAVEPHFGNVSCLTANTALYDRIHVIHGAIWDRSIPLEIADSSAGTWAFEVRESSADSQCRMSSCCGMTIGEIVESTRHDSIDLLKLDIEGSEKAVFSGNTEWLAKVGVLIVELHDRIQPGCSRALDDATSNHDFVSITKGDLRMLISRRVWRGVQGVGDCTV